MSGSLLRRVVALTALVDLAYVVVTVAARDTQANANETLIVLGGQAAMALIVTTLGSRPSSEVDANAEATRRESGDSR